MPLPKLVVSTIFRELKSVQSVFNQKPLKTYLESGKFAVQSECFALAKFGYGVR
jgi:hypothetical protein